MRQNRSIAITYAGWLMLFIPLTVFIIFIVAPLCSNYILSMQKVSMFGENNFVGMKNYLNIAEDTASLQAIAQTFHSPFLFLRILFLTAAPLALSLLLMELRLSGRVTVKLIVSPLIILSGAVILSVVFRLNVAASIAGGSETNLLDPGYVMTSLNDLLLITGLALALPLGSVFFPGIMQGTRLMIQDPAKMYREFWSRAWRLVIAFAICVAGYSLASYEGAYPMRSPGAAASNIITRYFAVAFQYFKIGNGAALVELLIIPLVMMGLGLMLVLELPKPEISIRYVPKIKEKLLTGARPSTGRIAGIILSALVMIFVVILLVANGLKGIGSPQEGDVRIPGTLLASLFGSMLQSFRIAFPSALICLIVTMSAGFALGYLAPRGSKILLIVVGVFLFITPALVLIPLFFFTKSLGLINSLTSVILPGCISPLGIILFTWFFRGMKDDCTGIEAAGNVVSLRALGKRAAVSLVLFSLPMLAIYLLLSMNMILLPLTMLSKADSYTLPLFLLMTMQSYSMPAAATFGTIAWLAMLQYVPPLALLVVSIVTVFPRLAVVIRKKDEAVAVQPAVLAKIGKPEGEHVESGETVLSEPAKKPTSVAWLSVFPLALFAIALVLIVPGTFVPAMLVASLIITAVGLLTGAVLYYVFVYSIHRTLATVTSGRFPISPAKAILFHFIPVFNLYWIWKWTSGVSNFVNQQKPRLAFLPGVFLFIYYTTIAVSLIVSSTILVDLALIWSVLAAVISTTALLGLSLYMAEQVRKTVVAE